LRATAFEQAARLPPVSLSNAVAMLRFSFYATVSAPLPSVAGLVPFAFSAAFCLFSFLSPVLMMTDTELNVGIMGSMHTWPNVFTWGCFASYFRLLFLLSYFIPGFFLFT
jgi:hypothetical protein